MKSLEPECFHQETTAKTVGRKQSAQVHLGSPDRSEIRTARGSVVGNFGGEGVAAASP